MDSTTRKWLDIANAVIEGEIDDPIKLQNLNEQAVPLRVGAFTIRGRGKLSEL